MNKIGKEGRTKIIDNWSSGDYICECGKTVTLWFNGGELDSVTDKAHNNHADTLSPKKKKDCIFQYATAYQYISTDIHFDTGLITLEKAKSLWRENLPKFIQELQGGSRPEMVIWTGCRDTSDYHTELAHIDDNCETDGVRVYKVTKEEITV